MEDSGARSAEVHRTDGVRRERHNYIINYLTCTLWQLEKSVIVELYYKTTAGIMAVVVMPTGLSVLTRY